MIFIITKKSLTFKNKILVCLEQIGALNNLSIILTYLPCFLKKEIDIWWVTPKSEWVKKA